MPVADGEVIKAVLTITAPQTVICQNVFYWQMDDPTPDSPSNSAVLTAVDIKLSAMAADIAAYLNNAYEYDEVKVDRVEWNVDFWETVENIGVASITQVGGSAIDACPHGVAATITADTTRPQTRARKFLPGIPENELEDSTLSGALITALTAYILEWLTNKVVLGDAELVPVVLGGSGASAGLIYALISAGINGISGYQRRRKPGVGA